MINWVRQSMIGHKGLKAKLMRNTTEIKLALLETGKLMIYTLGPIIQCRW
jgi:hypothetical protein